MVVFLSSGTGDVVIGAAVLVVVIGSSVFVITEGSFSVVSVSDRSDKKKTKENNKFAII